MCQKLLNLLVFEPLALIFRRQKVEVQRRPVPRPFRLRYQACRPGPVPPHVPAEGLTGGELRPTIRALVDRRRRNPPPSAVTGSGVQVERRWDFFLRRRKVVVVGVVERCRFLVVFRLRVARPMASKGLE